MSIMHAIKNGMVGTPEVQNFLDAIAQLADVVSGCATALEVVAVPATDVMLFQEANLAAALGCKRTIHFELQNAAGDVQKWFNGAGTITPGEHVTDAQVGVPVVTGGNSIQFIDGVAEVEFALDTDANSTKTYANADYVTIACAVGNIMGVAVGATGATHTLTCEAHPLLYATPKTSSPTAAQANSAGASSMKRQIAWALKDSGGNILTWLDGTLTLTPTETCNDGQIGIPVVTGGNTVTITGGVGHSEFAYDTDADVTKHYIPTDFVTITPAMANVGEQTVTVTQGIVVDTFV